MKWVSVASYCLGFLSVLGLLVSAIEASAGVRGVWKPFPLRKIAEWGQFNRERWNKWDYYLKLFGSLGVLIAIGLQIFVQLMS